MQDYIIATIIGLLFVLLIVHLVRSWKNRDTEEEEGDYSSGKLCLNHRKDKAESCTGNPFHATADAKLENAIKNNVVRHWSSVNTFSDVGGWRKVLDKPHVAYKATEDGILELIIPRGARVIAPENQVGNYTKMRTDEVWANTLMNSQGRPLSDNTAESIHRSFFHYKVGERNEPDSLDISLNKGCSNGIHFFPNFDQAKDWYFSHATNPYRTGNRYDRLDQRRKDYKKRKMQRKRDALQPGTSSRFGWKSQSDSSFPKKKGSHK